MEDVILIQRPKDIKRSRGRKNEDWEKNGDRKASCVYRLVSSGRLSTRQNENQRSNQQPWTQNILNRIMPPRPIRFPTGPSQPHLTHILRMGTLTSVCGRTEHSIKPEPKSVHWPNQHTSQHQLYRRLPASTLLSNEYSCFY